MKKSIGFKTLALSLLVMTLWGSLYPVVKLGYSVFGINSKHVPDILMFAGMRFVISGLVVSCFCLFKKEKIAAPKGRNIGFIVLYIVTGMVGYQKLIDILPVLGAVFSSLGVFQRDEQKTRFLILLNAVAYCSYYCIVGSTSMLAELITVIGNGVAMIKYRKKNEKQSAQ